MRPLPLKCALLVLSCWLVLPVRAAHIGYNSDNVLVIDFTRKIFPLGVTLPPAPNAKTPAGKNAFKELHDAGMLFMRTGIASAWDAAGIATEKKYEDGAAKFGMFCQPWLRTLATTNTPANDAQLTSLVNTFKGHPGLGMWKGADEPFWGGTPAATCQHVYQVIKAADPDHPVWIVEAPRGTSSDMAPYNAAVDIHGVDIYPVSYPPGNHLVSTYPNKDISCVGEWTDVIVNAVGGVSNTKPVMMTLQIAFSGTTPPTKQLRFPDYTQARFMAYNAIIHGARGLQFFGGSLAATLNTADAALGWNWTYWNSTLKRLCLEIGDTSPLQPALVAANANLGISATNGVEFVVRQVGANDLYIIASKSQGASNTATQTTFSGIPAGYTQGSVMYEEPTVVSVSGGSFTHYFGPFDVHVYWFHK